MGRLDTCYCNIPKLLLQESSEYETDSDDETNARQLLKPMFVPKAARDVSGTHTRI